MFLSILFTFIISSIAAAVFAAPGDVIMTHGSMSTTSIPLWVTEDRGLFAKHGAKVKVVWMRGNSMQIATLASGETQIAYGGATTALAAAAGGQELKIIASFTSRESLDLVARPGIAAPADLRGKRFGIQSIGGGVWKTAAVWLEHFGLDERRDNIQMIVIGDVTVLAQALETGRVDATVVPGFLSRRLAEKGFVVLGSSEKTKLPSVGMTLLAEKAYVQKNSETLQNVLKGLVESTVFIARPENKPAVLQTIMKHFKMTDAAAAEGAYQDVLALVRLEDYRKPYVSVDGLKTLQRMMATQSARIADVKAENLVDSTVVRKLDDGGFFERLYAEYRVKQP
ncbi:MAG TPA: ABC transporter substrate-binding protein [Candidatus Binatia bacterium]|nr:ABC transporter substrate-binding protein [Candidatus Binatia bacterium]